MIRSDIPVGTVVEARGFHAKIDSVSKNHGGKMTRYYGLIVGGKDGDYSGLPPLSVGQAVGFYEDEIVRIVDINAKTLTAESSCDLLEEVVRARAKFPGNRFLLAALTEEVGELARAYLQREGRERVRREALQVACVAMRIYEEGDATFDDVTDAEAKP